MDLGTPPAPDFRIRSAKRSRRALIPFLAVVIAFGALLWGDDAVANSRYAAIVIDAVSGEVLHQENANRRLYPASLTKMMTLYMTFQAVENGTLRLNQRITISRRAAGQTPSRLGLRAGATIRVEDAIYALVTKSANDVATAIAEALAGTEYQFALRMTEQARRLGMSRTTFRNASGLPHRQQRSTAYDMALLSQALISHFPQHYHYFSSQRWSFNGRTYRNHNELLRTYEGMDGLKTGYIRASGYNLAASAVRGRLRLITVVFGGRTSQRRNRAVAQLTDEAFASSRGRYLIAHGSAPFYPPLPPRRPGSAEPTLVAAVETSGESPVPPRHPEYAAKDVVAARHTGVFPAGAAPIPPLPGGRLETAESSARLDVGSRPGLPTKVWGIQVGAFFDASTSQRAIDTAKNKVPDLLVAAPRVVMPVETSRGRMYRARIMGLNQQEAITACDRLQAAGNDCLPLAPDSDF